MAIFVNRINLGRNIFNIGGVGKVVGPMGMKSLSDPSEGLVCTCGGTWQLTDTSVDVLD